MDEFSSYELGNLTSGRAARWPRVTELSADWLLERLKEEAWVEGQPLTERDVQMLRTPIFELEEHDKNPARQLNDRVVFLARSAMERAKVAGAETVKVRRGIASRRIGRSTMESCSKTSCLGRYPQYCRML